MNSFYGLLAAALGFLAVLGGTYYKGRKDKDNEITIEEAEVANDAKESLEEIRSADDAEYLKRVRDAER